MEWAFPWGEVELVKIPLLAFSKQQQHKLTPLTLQSCNSHLKLVSEWDPWTYSAENTFYNDIYKCTTNCPPS